MLVGGSHNGCLRRRDGRRRTCRRADRLQIARDGAQIFLAHVLRAVFHHLVHAAECRSVRGAAGAEKGDEIGARPLRGGRAVGVAQRLRIPAVDQRAGQETVAAPVAGRLDAAGQAVARRVAFAAMAEALHQIGAAVPFGAACRVRRVDAGLQIEKVPAQHQPAHAERPRQIGRRRLLGDRRHAALEVRVQRMHVRVVDACERGVRHRRIQMPAVLANAFAQRTREIGFGVVADAAGLVGRDVGRDDRAERRLHRQAAGERHLARAGVAADAVAGARQVETSLDQCVWRFSRRRDGCRGRRGRSRCRRCIGRRWRRARPRRRLLPESPEGPGADHRRDDDAESGDAQARFRLAVHASAPGLLR